MALKTGYILGRGFFRLEPPFIPDRWFDISPNYFCGSGLLLVCQVSFLLVVIDIIILKESGFRSVISRT